MATARIARPYYRVHIIRVCYVCNRRYRPQCVVTILHFIGVCLVLIIILILILVLVLVYLLDAGALFLLARLDNLHGDALGNGIRGDVRDQRLLLR